MNPMRIIRLVLFALLALTVAAHAQTGSPKTPAQLNAEINAQCPDNIIQQCTPAIYRQHLLDIVASGVNILSSGVICTGVNDYAAVQAAVTAAVTAGGGTVRLTGTCAMGSNTLSFGGSGVTIDGGDVNATTMVFTNTTNDSVQMGKDGLPGWSGNAIKNLTIRDTSRGSGQTIFILGASQPKLDTVTVDTNGAHFSLFAQQFNDVKVVNARFYGGVTLFSPANNTQRSDQFTIDNSVIVPNAQMDCLHIDGMVQTINSNRLAMLNCAVGLNITNNSHSANFFPAFGTFVNLQIDGASARAAWIQAGYNMQFIGSDFNGSGATSDIPVVQIDPDAGGGGSITRQVKFIGGGIHDTYGRCLVTNSVDFSLIGTDVYDCGKNAANTYAAIEIAQASGTSSALIANSKIGFATGQGSTSNYGVAVDGTVTGAVLLSGNNYGGNQTGAINDASGKATVNGGINIDGVSPLPLPTTCTGHPAGSLRNNAGVVNVC